MKNKVRLVALLLVEVFMTVCFVFSLIQRNAPSAVLCGFAAVFTGYSLMSIIIPNRDREYAIYRQQYAAHLDGIFTNDNRYLNGVLRIISFSNGSTPRFGAMYASKIMKAAKTDREKAVVSYFSGVCCSKSNDFPGARDYYLNAVRYDGTYHQAWRALADTYVLLGDLPSAENAYERAISDSPDTASYHAEKAALYVKMKKFPDAEKEAREAINIEEAIRLPYKVLADVAHEKNDTAEEEKYVAEYKKRGGYDI